MCAPSEKKRTSLEKFIRINFKWIVTIIVEIVWFTWALLDADNIFGRFVEETPYFGYYYYMSITMVFGSLIAGATSEGGGAVAFPVMTLVLSVPPSQARDFSFAIQSFGMTCASVIIFFLRVSLDYEALIWSTVGGVVGLLAGLEFIAPYLLPAYAKMFFVSLWLSFAVALFRLNQRKDRRVFDSSKESDEFVYTQACKKDLSVDNGGEDVTSAEEARKLQLLKIKRWRTVKLFVIGTFGGICSSIAGSGLDMATFSILTLYYRVSEKVATPTSVVLMAGNAVFGTIFRLLRIGGGYPPGAEAVLWKFVSVCVPIVVIGAPVGAHIPTILSRHQISCIVYFLSVFQFFLALGIVKPWTKPAPHNVRLIVASAVTLFGGSVFFYKAADWGEGRDVNVEEEKKLEEMVADNSVAVDDE